MTWPDYIAGQRLFVAGVEQSPRRNAWNFVGVSATFNTSTQMWDITVGVGSGGHVLESNGVPVTQRSNLNVTGLLQLTDSGGKSLLHLPNINLATQTTGTLTVARGGTGLGALGTALQALRVNAAATALEYYTPAAGMATPGGDGHLFTFSTTTADADPGAGTIRLNNATPASVTQIYVDDVDASAVDVTAWLASLDDANGASKGRITVRSITDPTKKIVYSLTAWTTAVGYKKLTVAHVSGTSLPTTTAADTFLSFDSGPTLTGGTSVTISAAGAVARAALTGDVTAAADSNSLTIPNDTITFAKMLNATATDKLIGSDAAGDFKELSFGGAGLERSGTQIQVASQLPARGTENVAVDAYPSTQTQGTIANGATVNSDVAIATGKRYKIYADVWVDDGAGGAVQFTKSIMVNAHQTGGVAVKVSENIIDDNLASGWSFTAAVSTTNIRFSLVNSSGSSRSYNLLIGSTIADKP